MTFGFYMTPATINIVTFTLNGLDDALRTAQSIASQDYQNIEYILKDGDSMDGTIE